MVRAAATGIFDFNRIDPWDAWWWRKLRWALDELSLQQSCELSKIQHTHWITLASRDRLAAEDFEKLQINANEALSSIFKATYPWLADEIGTGGDTSAEAVVAQHQQVFGKPGDPEYEAMLDTMYHVFKKGPLSPLEKERDRKRRREKRRAAEEARQKIRLEELRHG